MVTARGVEHVQRVGRLGLGDSPLLTSLSGFENLLEIDESLAFYDLPALVSLEPLAALRRASALSIYNVAITDLHGLEGISGLDFVLVRECPSVETLDGLPPVTSLRELFLVDNPALRDISALATLVEVREDGLWIGYNETLTSYAGLEALEVVRGEAGIGDDAALAFAGFDGLREVEGRLFLRPLGAESLEGLGRLERVGGDLRIEGDEFTVSLAGMTSLTELEADLILQGVPTTEGLEGITTIGGSLQISWEEHIVDLDGLSGLRTVGNYVQIDHNDALTSLTGLHGIESIAGGLVITDNASITDEDAWAVVDAIGEANIGGNIVIEDNGP